MEVWMYRLYIYIYIVSTILYAIIINASDSCAAYIFVETMINYFWIILWIEVSQDQQSLLE